TWGTETGIIEAEVSGYYPYRAEVPVGGTRAETRHDIYLDPWYEVYAWINGTLVDENEDPIPGGLTLTDIDHPALEPYYIEVNETGIFSFQFYPGNYTVEFYNDTLFDSAEIQLTMDGIEGLVLQLIPRSFINGTVVDWSGSPIAGINVTLKQWFDDGDGLYSNITDRTLTDEGGNFSFLVTKGSYDIFIPRTELYDSYETPDEYQTNGWIDIYGIHRLGNRSEANIKGRVTGTAGPYADGIPWATVKAVVGGFEKWDITDEEGYFEIEDVSHGTYTIRATPPMNLTFDPANGRWWGYVWNYTYEFNVSGYLLEINPVLEYMEEIPPGYVNITGHSPTGTDVYINEPIVIQFSERMNKTKVEEAISVEPALSDPVYKWDSFGRMLTIEHDPFQPATVYTVEVGYRAVSIDGWPLYERNGFSWSFTTGNETDPWEIFTAEVELVDMVLYVDVTAPESQSIYICIIGKACFRVSEGSPGTYSENISGFNYNTQYHYYFTDEDGGTIKAPQFSGYFTTPEAPVTPPGWMITLGRVTINDDGDWEVYAEGMDDIPVYIVIPGIGSFKLDEVEPGEYETVIDSEEFDEGEEYSYYFSDREGGENLAPQFSGTLVQPKGADDDDVDDDSTFRNICIGLCLGSIILILVMVVVILLVRKRGQPKGLDEE
ncbi:MAG: Ig-like domain-containing protein, partial [Thermoplasmatota archaeon]